MTRKSQTFTVDSSETETWTVTSSTETVTGGYATEQPTNWSSYWQTAWDIWQRSRWWKLLVPLGFIAGWFLHAPLQMTALGLLAVIYVAWTDLLRERNAA